MIQVTPGRNYKCDLALLYKRLERYLLLALDQATDEFLNAMKRHVNDKVTKNSPGEHDPSWSSEIDRDLKKLKVAMVNHYLESEVGLEGAGYGTGGNNWARVRAMQVAYGSGDKAVNPSAVVDYGPSGGAGGSAIHFGPSGRYVWNDSLTGRHKSKSTRDVNAPEGFNQSGNLFPETAYAEIKDRAIQIMEDAMKNVPNDIQVGIIHAV